MPSIHTVQVQVEGGIVERESEGRDSSMDFQMDYKGQGKLKRKVFKKSED